MGMIFMPMEYLNGGVYKTQHRRTQLYPKQQHVRGYFRYKGGLYSYKTNMAIHGEDLVSL
jgi:hypothetical protein